MFHSIAGYHKTTKELMVIKTLDTAATKQQSENLQTLIAAAQSGNKQALLQLCENFSPLLKSEARREMFFKSLGRDAEGIAVVAFIELVLKYDGADFTNWPGFARCKVHFALFDAMEKQGRIWENEVTLDTASEEGVELLDNCCPDEGHLDELARLLLSLELSEALTQLSGIQRQVLQLLFLQGLKPVEVAQKLDCSVRNISKHRTKGLAQLRTLLKQNS